ncbi:zinc finger BED domain-containing protein 4-like [Xyrauchen texanus]|uniref:zinc finger BED domain-containing protein 4-like n=1 Tax=Xyrauchen texanus TaxID=154827 RepID=UPI002241DF97|nr:zinc finger BED domain-containing protein 4-like [Xyrauchen texanus]
MDYVIGLQNSTEPRVEMERQPAFDHWMFKHHFTFNEARGRNITVQCNLCLPKVNILSTARDSTSNLKKHLERKHAEHYRKSPSGDGPSESGHEVKGPSDKKHAKMDHTVYNYTTQSKLNALVFNFIVEDVQPISILEQPGFRKLIEVLSRGKKVMSRKTFDCRLEAGFDKMKEELKKKLDSVQSLCTTADIWTVNNRSYFGMTCHWLEDNLERRSAALSCTRIYGRHACETVIAKIQEIHSSYSIESKIRATVTDNASHFVKAKEFSSEEDFEVDESQFEDLGSILSEGEMGADFFLSYFLPPHQRCAAQTLNLIASKDLADAISTGPTHKLHDSSMAKCVAIWHKARDCSTVVADAMESIANVQFTAPCMNQWSSKFFAVNKLMSLTDSQLTELTDLLDVPNFMPEEIAYLKEYADVFKAVAVAFDLLQGEENCFIGIVIPTLLTLKRKLQEKMANTHFFSEVIDHTVKAIDSRFKQIIDSPDARLATTTMPQFRLWWLPESEREVLRAQLVTEVSQLVFVPETANNNVGSVNEDEFFSYGPGSSGNRDGNRGAAEEVRMYLEGTNKDLKCLDDFPRIKKVFIKFNTPLTSSTPVERLFSHDGNIITPKRNQLADEHFERVLLLRYNSKICSLALE